jgi:uncharacterized protein YciI
MGFLIYGQDSADFDDGPHSLHEVHQAYMDQWASRFVARGPTLSEDGSRHTGSVHVLDTPDPRLAQRFAFDEPYAKAGWYSDIAVSPFESLIAGTMWDRAVSSVDQESSFALASWMPARRTTGVVDSIRSRVAGGDGPPWSFVGLLLGDESAQIVGLAGSADVSPPAISRWLLEQLAALPLSDTDIAVHRWQRGGRPLD